MEPQSFYINRDYIKHNKLSDQQTDTVPIRINCTGYGKYERPFITNGARLDWYIQLVDEGSMQSECGEVKKCQFIVWPPEKPPLRENRLQYLLLLLGSFHGKFCGRIT